MLRIVRMEVQERSYKSPFFFHYQRTKHDNQTCQDDLYHAYDCGARLCLGLIQLIDH